MNDFIKALLDHTRSIVVALPFVLQFIPPLRRFIVPWRRLSQSRRLHALGQFCKVKDWLRLRLIKSTAFPGSPSALSHITETIAWLAANKTWQLVVRQFSREEHIEYDPDYVINSNLVR